VRRSAGSRGAERGEAGGGGRGCASARGRGPGRLGDRVFSGPSCLRRVLDGWRGL